MFGLSEKEKMDKFRGLSPEDQFALCLELSQRLDAVRRENRSKLDQLDREKDCLAVMPRSEFWSLKTFFDASTSFEARFDMALTRALVWPCIGHSAQKEAKRLKAVPQR